MLGAEVRSFYSTDARLALDRGWEFNATASGFAVREFEREIFSNTLM